jgi:RNA polymerase sigma factor (sigma-70 family)
MILSAEYTRGWLAALFAGIRAFLDRKPAEKTAARAEINRRAERLLDEYGNSILRLAYSYLHNKSDAEDILQDTLIQYLKTEPVLENPYHEKSWLLKVAANLSKNRIDYNRIRRADELQETLAADEREDLSFVWEAVKELPEKYREVIHLFHYEGYPVAMIADILGRNESTVRSDLRRGRQRLKSILKEAYDFEQI